MNHVYRYLPFRLMLRAPALITAHGSDPNSVRSLDHVPGAQVRGALWEAIRTTHAADKQDEIRDRLVLSGQVRFLPAYLELEGVRSLPTPRSWRQPKDPEAHLDGPDLAGVAHWPEEALSPCAFRFVTLGGWRLLAANARRIGRPHHQQDLVKGRAWQDANGHTRGALFSYEALAPGQTLCGVMACFGDTPASADALLHEVQRLLEGRAMHVGRSQRGGYGGYGEIEFDPIREHEFAMREHLVNRDLQQGSLFALLLTSPCLVRDRASGTMDPAALPGLLQQMLPQVEVYRSCHGFVRVGGFNRTWGLPLPQNLGLDAGSVAVLRARGPVALAELLEIEHAGLGERRIDGFGRCVFLEAKANWRVERVTTRLTAPVPLRGSEAEPHAMLDRMQRRLLEERIPTEIVRAAQSIVASARTVPSRSLLGRIRTQLRSGRSGLKVAAWLASLARPARRQLDRCKVTTGTRDPRQRQVTLHDWLQVVLHEWNWGTLSGGESEGTAELKHTLQMLSINYLQQSCCLVSEEDTKRAITAQMPGWMLRLADAVLSGLRTRSIRDEQQVTP